MALVTGNHQLTALYNVFLTDFEAAFEICANGSLRADADHLELVRALLANHQLAIAVVTGVDIPNTVRWCTGGRGRISATNANKQTLLACFGICYAAYVKYCQTLDRNLAEPFRAADVVARAARAAEAAEEAALEQQEEAKE
mmetsp:Transcript_740/g.879  ORF Transcript_740/g.879 Transcript_740/m.879 type:complete len:142 (+) Transcript_740:38-463(+)|eukprot:CAMPEP_0205821234 /NCGR_PEP_ID=MMETSP0206-20130828/6180_1 /ASSEMBLY_ACC=CAM_ASM_000279 /TAXON_ID=36767 /ORGANISM="Euplotes focardii, Strain TN1" /LENGTH=141 /DNA_ID=CAMNT_0053116537 /DNA_START=38 /DNA_END=463 /DNA_ORIENTATION=+